MDWVKAISSALIALSIKKKMDDSGGAGAGRIGIGVKEGSGINIDRVCGREALSISVYKAGSIWQVLTSFPCMPHSFPPLRYPHFYLFFHIYTSPTPMPTLAPLSSFRRIQPWMEMRDLRDRERLARKLRNSHSRRALEALFIRIDYGQWVRKEVIENRSRQLISLHIILQRTIKQRRICQQTIRQLINIQLIRQHILFLTKQEIQFIMNLRRNENVFQQKD